MADKSGWNLAALVGKCQAKHWSLTKEGRIRANVVVLHITVDAFPAEKWQRNLAGT